MNFPFQESSVGYEIRFDSKKPRDTCAITFVTTGIVFQMLRSDPALSNVSHIVLDEVHERDLCTDILLGALKNIYDNKLNPKLKIIVMSASLNIQKFAVYFHQAPVIEIPGRCFEVEQFFLEDFIGDLGNVNNDENALRRYFNNFNLDFVRFEGSCIL